MALVKGTVPIGHATARRAGFLWQKDSNGRPFITKYTRRKANPGPPRPIEPFANTPIPVASYARNFLRTYSKAWTNVLTAAQRSAWEALAASQTVMVDSGLIKTLTGKQFYDWWSATQYFWSGPVAALESLTFQYIWTTPPVTWDPPIQPYALSITAIDDLRITVEFSTTPNLDPFTGWALISALNPRTHSRQVRHFVRANIAIAGVDPPTGRYQFDVFLNPTFLKAAQLRNPGVNIRIMSDAPNLVPSNWAGIIVP